MPHDFEPEPCIRFCGVRMDFPVPRRKRETVQVLNGITLDLPGSGLTAIGGPPGSGKSTTLLCAAGLERIVQEYNLVGSLTGEDNIALPAGVAGHRTPSNRVVETMTRPALPSMLANAP